MKENKGGHVPIIGEWHLIDRVPRYLNDNWDYDPGFCVRSICWQIRSAGD